jgi:hypothetical protein
MRKHLRTLVIGAAILAVAFLVVRYYMTCCPKTEYFATVLWNRNTGEDVRLPPLKVFASRKDCLDADNQAAKLEIEQFGILGSNKEWIGRCALITHDWKGDRWTIQLVNEEPTPVEPRQEPY